MSDRPSFKEAYEHLFFFWYKIKKLDKIRALEKVIIDLEGSGYPAPHLKKIVDRFYEKKKCKNNE